LGSGWFGDADVGSNGFASSPGVHNDSTEPTPGPATFPERAGPLPPRTSIGVRAAALTLATRFLPASSVESPIARRFGLPDYVAQQRRPAAG
jgi:hypothetical protein